MLDMISTNGGVGRALPGRSRRYDQALVGVAAACLGLLGLMALFVTPLLVVAVLPPAVVLCRLGVQVSRLERAATRDGITGLFNSNGWRALAESVVVRRDRSVGIVVLMIDLDHFKSINDTYGHLAGNAVLDAVASAIVRSIRDKDTAGRFGGDEFVVLLSEITSVELARVAERVRAAIAALQVGVLMGRNAAIMSRLSVSIGASYSAEDSTQVDQLLSAADRALYAAKHSGRNIVRHA
jgi:diguanylate cyclase (GGDEF)-like protein